MSHKPIIHRRCGKEIVDPREPLKGKTSVCMCFDDEPRPGEPTPIVDADITGDPFADQAFDKAFQYEPRKR